MFPGADPQVVTSPGTNAALVPVIDSAVAARTASAAAVAMLDPRENEAGNASPGRDPENVVSGDTVGKPINLSRKVKSATGRRRNHVIGVIVRRNRVINMTNMRERKIENVSAQRKVRVIHVT